MAPPPPLLLAHPAALWRGGVAASAAADPRGPSGAGGAIRPRPLAVGKRLDAAEPARPPAPALQLAGRSLAPPPPAAAAPSGAAAAAAAAATPLSPGSSVAQEQQQQAGAGALPQWYAAVGLSAMAALICSVDRAAISVAILPMSEQYGWSDSTKGAINSAFYIGYTLTNLVGGYLASSISAKRVLGWGVVLWSIFTITTPAAARASMPVLLGNRAVMGAGEGVTFPSVQNVVKFWVPADVRTRALTLIYSGGQLGTIVALVTSPLIIKSLGWEAVFEVYGSLGLFWMLAWQRLVSDMPPPPPQQLQLQQPAAAKLPHAAPSAPRAGEQAGAAQPPQAAAAADGQLQPQQPAPAAAGLPRFSEIPWGSFFTNRAFLALLLAHSSFGVGHYVCLSWLPTYYSQEFGVDVQQSALLSVLPWFVTVIVSNSSGWIADGLVNSGRLSMTATRKLLQTAGSVGPALCLLHLALAHGDGAAPLEMGEAVVLLTATLSLCGFQSAGFASNHQDISSKYAAVLFGITNALSSLMGTFSVYATGVILDAAPGSWPVVFELVAVCYLAGAVAFATSASAEPQFE